MSAVEKEELVQKAKLAEQSERWVFLLNFLIVFLIVLWLTSEL